MKTKYNRSQIMKNAWRTYKYVGKKNGQTFGEVLASTWKLAKCHASMEESMRRKKAEREALREFYRTSVQKVEVSYSNYSYEDLYGTFQSGRYVGD